MGGMSIQKLGFSGQISHLIDTDALDGFELGRVTVEHKDRYIVQTVSAVLNAEILGNLRFSARSREELPAVGDWVSISMMDKNSAIIHKVHPRTSILERQAIAQFGEKQIIATNIDLAFIVQSVNQDFNLNRIERYLIICHSAGITPVLLLSKTDLADSLYVSELVAQVKNRISDLRIIPLSNVNESGYEELYQIMEAFKTYCFLGSSGVGKSTIVNHMLGEVSIKTNEISNSTNKGRHTTSRRELIVLPNESIVIDTPGMRELGVTEQALGLDLTFGEITEISANCRFRDCTHTTESGCAVLEAMKDGIISQDVFQNYQKLMREQKHFSSSIQEKRKKGKEQGKLYKSILQEKRKTKF